jgi:hypothetical protein
MAEGIENAIRQNAQGPELAEVDGVKVKQHPLPGQIAADKYLAGKDGMRRNPGRSGSASIRPKRMPAALPETAAACIVGQKDGRHS